MAPHGVYPCAAKSWVAIAVRSDDEWRAFAELVGGGEVALDKRFAMTAGRLEHADELDETVAAWTRVRPAAFVEELLQAHGIPAHTAVSSADAVRDPQLAARGHFVELEHPIHGTTVVQGSRYRLSETPAVVTRPAPTLGCDNDHVLRNLLGYDDGRIASLAEAGALS